MHKKIIALLLGCLCCTATKAQDAHQFLNLSQETTNADSIILFAEKGLSISDSTQYSDIYCNLLLRYSSGYLLKQEYDTAYQNTFNAYNVALQMQNDTCIAKSACHLGTILFRQKKYSDAEIWFNKSLNYYKIASDTINICDPYMGIGNVRNAQGQVDSSQYYYELSIEAAQKSQTRKSHLATVFSNIGTLHFQYTKDYEKCIWYAQKSLLIAKETKNIPKQITTLNVIGAAYMQSNQLDKAIPILEEAVQLNKGINDRSLFYSCNNLGICFKRKKEYPKAMNSYRKILSKVKPNTLFYGMAMSNIGNVYKELGQIDSAFIYLRQGHDAVMNTTNTRQKVSSHIALAKAYKENRNFEEAYSYAIKGFNLQDTFLNEERTQALAAAAAKFQTRLYKDSLTISQVEIKVTELEEETQRNWKFFFLTLAAALAALTWLLFNKMKTAKRTEKQIAHENERLISANTDLLQETEEMQEKISSYDFIKKNHITVNGQKIILGDIIYLKSDSKIVNIHTKEGMIRNYGSLKGFLSTLPNKHFVQVHKSYIVNLSEIKTMPNNDFFLMNDDTRIKVGRAFKNNFSTRLSNYNKENSAN